MNMRSARVLIMAGGTGGHIYPALSIAKLLKEQGADIEWLGTANGLEASLVPQHGYPLHCISMVGLRGRGLLSLIQAPFRTFFAMMQAVRMLMQLRPDCVLGMGGFVTAPGGVAAKLLGKRLIIHEQNAIAGFSNRILFPLAQRVCEGFPAAFTSKQTLLEKYYRGSNKVITTGNPVREKIAQLPEYAERLANRGVEVTRTLRLLVIGGSLGAKALNDLLPQWLINYSANHQNFPNAIEVLHQTGTKLYQQTLETYEAAGLQVNAPSSSKLLVKVQPYIDDIALAYGWADLALCRAGASTITELAVAGLPAILVPYPWAVDDHQFANANFLVQRGAAWLLPQSQLTVQALDALVRPLHQEPARLLVAAIESRRSAYLFASAKVAEICLEACNV